MRISLGSFMCLVTALVCFANHSQAEGKKYCDDVPPSGDTKGEVCRFVVEDDQNSAASTVEVKGCEDFGNWYYADYTVELRFARAQKGKAGK